MPATVDMQILGELVVLVGGQQMDLPGPSVRALLGALLLTPDETVGEERLLELAWGPGRGSRRALQCAVHRLRAWLHHTVGKGFGLGHAGSGYRLTVPDGAVDLVRFRQLARTGGDDPEVRLGRLRRALDEWRGPVLGGHPDWLTTDPGVRAVEQARVDCASALADVAIRLGRTDGAVAAVRRVAGVAFYDEQLQARLVRLLATSGRPAEALRHVETVRRLLADELGTEPSRDMRAAQAVAMRRDDPSGPVPRQLPPDVVDFTGRAGSVDAVLAPVLTGADRQAPLVFGIHGSAGTGTSTLAVHVAHRLAPAFPDGQLYADLRGTPDPTEVQSRFLRALGVADDEVPDGAADRGALFRSRTAGRRLLVVLDNAVHEAQVRPLVPGSAGCAVLVTSHTALAGLAGARPIPLAALSRAEAVELLGRVCGRDGVRTDPAYPAIAALCGDLPLALRVAGVRLAARPMLTPDRLAHLLRDEDRRLDELSVRGLATRPSLEAHYRELSDVDRVALLRLAQLPADSISAETAAAALGLPTAEAVARLEALVDARLVDAHGEDSAGRLRYGLPELVALHARERARAEAAAGPGHTARG